MNSSLCPALLTDRVEIFEHQLQVVQTRPEIQMVQVDIIDGLYADNLTLMPLDLGQFAWEQINLDLHLMTIEPLDLVMELKAAELNLPLRTIIAQVEKMTSQADFIYEVVKAGWQVGLSLDLYTPVEAIDQTSWREINLVQIMAVEAGFQGQQFQPLVLDKIKQLREWREQQNLDWQLAIDGGVKLEHLSALKQAGADIICVGSGLWQAADPQQAITTFIKQLN